MTAGTTGLLPRDIPTGDRTLRVVQHGSGPHVVLEAGGGCASDEWGAVQQLLPDLTTWSYDRAGEGASPGGPWTLDAGVADLAAWTDAVELPPRTVFVGHSMGCHVVRAFAHRYPDRVSALLLIDPRPPHFEHTAQARGLPVPTPPPDSQIYQAFTAADEAVAGLPVPEQPVALLVCDRFDGGPPGLEQADEAALSALWRAAQVDVGRAVGTAPLVVPGIGHMIPTDAPDRVAAEIRRLLG